MTVLCVAAIEEWRPIPWNPRYEISFIGEIKKHINFTHPERAQIMMMRTHQDRDGYACLRLRGQKWLLHRLVYAVFCGDLKNHLVVCHLDGNNKNNVASNLLQTTQAENISHKKLHGTHQEGEKHGMSLYDDDTVRLVKKAVAVARRGPTGRMRRFEAIRIANLFGVSTRLVQKINTENAWGHL